MTSSRTVLTPTTMSSLKPLEVNEIFTSIQGEGKFSGKPSIFIRLRRCNLACPKCDERDTWDSSLPGYYKFETYSPKELADFVNKIEGTRNVVITGGEPLIWRRQLNFFLEMLSYRFSVEIETNGTITPEGFDLYDNRVHYNVSPKLSSFHDSSRRTLTGSCLKWFAERASKGLAIFKFVITSETDLREVNDLVVRYDIPNEQVYLMPEGRTATEILNRLPMMFDLCKTFGYNLSSRLHILAFNNQKGT